MNPSDETLQTKLEDLRTQLFNVSKKSNLLYPHQQGIQPLQQIAAIDAFENTHNLLQVLKQHGSVAIPNALEAKQAYRLNKFIASSKKEVKEYGHHSLKIATLHLRWLNQLEEDDWVTSPLYFLDISIMKNTSYSIQANQSRLTINPVLESILAKNWNVSLPKTINIDSTKLTDIITLIQTQFQKNTKLELAYTPMNQQESSKKTWTIFDNDLLIGNFSYHKMNLVKDFNSILSSNSLPPLLRSFLLEEKKQVSFSSITMRSIEGLALICPADSSQETAIANSLKGQSLVIQGPPGTGKSQTITNIIAACLAKDKKVLFVSAKKTALKTVFSKLKKQKLAHLCSLIHHSQSDKKIFIKELKASYNHQASLFFNLKKNRAEKLQQIQIFNQAAQFLNRYEQHMQAKVTLSSSFTLKQLLDQLLILNTEPIKPKSIPVNLLPPLALFIKHTKILKELYKRLRELEFIDILAKHPIRYLKRQVFTNHKDAHGLACTLKEESLVWKTIHNLSQELPFPDDFLTQENLEVFKIQFTPYLYFWENNINELLESNSSAISELWKDAELFHELTEKSNRLAKINQQWSQKFNVEDTEYYLEIATKYDDVFMPILYADYRALKKELKARCTHHFPNKKRSKKELLSLLKNEYAINKELHDLTNYFSHKYGPLSVQDIFKLTRKWQAALDPKLKAIFINCMKTTKTQKNLHKLVKALNQMRGIENSLKSQSSTLISDRLQRIQKVLNSFSFIEQAFKPITVLAKEHILYDYFTDSLFTLEDITYNLYTEYYSNYLEKNPDYKEFTASKLSLYCQELAKAQTQIYRLNALEINAKQNDLFRQKIRLAHLSKKGLNADEKEIQQALKNGVQLLENEFDKTKSYRTIRYLKGGDAKPLINALKPVWMMSPQSVGDSLEFLPGQFDLVIFDEASQLSFEESIPALYRAKKCVVVGDSMQLPPTDFFHKSIASSAGAVDTKTSLLQQAKQVLPSISLTWHYRSRHEELISFNNAAFYQNTLKTVPAVKIQVEEFQAVNIDEATQAAFTYRDIRQKPLSFHYVKNSVYQDGVNEKEAAYIAELVKHLLLSQKALNLGILCPSANQQEAIERALSKITFFDQNFIALMNKKYQTDKGFDGIFIRNLENIQGEERDLIIVSMTYGPNENNILKLNFGPLNSSAGEKRLNVLFSRAKKHLLIVSSIRSIDIETSDNSAVRCLKSYLNFAEQLSLGNREKVKQLIEGLNQANRPVASWVHMLAEAIISAGYYVEVNYGYSSLKCCLAIKLKNEDEQYILGVLTDESASFYTQNIRHSFVFQAAILEEFGWNIEFVLAKDFLANKVSVLNRLLAQLKILQNTSNEELKEVSEIDSMQATVFDEDKLLFTRLEKRGDNPQFWELAGNLRDIVIRYGKLGSKGRKLIKTYPSVAKVIKEKRKLIRQKEKLGYRRV